MSMQVASINARILLTVLVLFGNYMVAIEKSWADDSGDTSLTLAEITAHRYHSSIAPHFQISLVPGGISQVVTSLDDSTALNTAGAFRGSGPSPQFMENFFVQLPMVPTTVPGRLNDLNIPTAMNYDGSAVYGFSRVHRPLGQTSYFRYEPMRWSFEDDGGFGAWNYGQLGLNPETAEFSTNISGQVWNNWIPLSYSEGAITGLAHRYASTSPNFLLTPQQGFIYFEPSNDPQTGTLRVLGDLTPNTADFDYVLDDEEALSGSAVSLSGELLGAGDSPYRRVVGYGYGKANPTHGCYRSYATRADVPLSFTSQVQAPFEPLPISHSSMISFQNGNCPQRALGAFNSLQLSQMPGSTYQYSDSVGLSRNGQFAAVNGYFNFDYNGDGDFELGVRAMVKDLTTNTETVLSSEGSGSAWRQARAEVMHPNGRFILGEILTPQGFMPALWDRSITTGSNLIAEIDPLTQLNIPEIDRSLVVGSISTGLSVEVDPNGNLLRFRSVGVLLFNHAPSPPALANKCGTGALPFGISASGLGVEEIGLGNSLEAYAYSWDWEAGGVSSLNSLWHVLKFNYALDNVPFGYYLCDAILSEDGKTVSGMGSNGRAFVARIANPLPLSHTSLAAQQAALENCITANSCEAQLVPDVDGLTGYTIADLHHFLNDPEHFSCNLMELYPSGYIGCYGDVDGNNQVNPGDRGFISANKSLSDPIALCLYDLDGNGFISPSDRGYVAANINQCNPLPPHQNGSGLYCQSHPLGGCIMTIDRRFLHS